MVALLTACGATAAIGRTVQQVEKTCPYDGTTFEFTEQASGTAFGQQLDYRPVGALVSPWPMAVCPTNGFVFFKAKFDDAELEKLRPIVLSAEYQAMKGETPYYRAFWLLDRSGAPHVEVSAMLLAATWEAEGDPERYQRYAARLAERLPGDIAAAGSQERRMFQLLLGELMRRQGKFSEAKRYFSGLSGELEPVSNDGLHAAFELMLIEHGDRGPHLMSEALAVAETNPDIWWRRRTPRLSAGRLTQTHAFKFNGANVHWLTNDALTGSTRQNLLQFDLASGTTTVKGPPVTWGHADFSPDGRLILSTTGTGIAFGGKGDDWRLVQIDARTYEVRHSASVPSPGAQKFAFSYDGKSALARIETGLVAFDLGSDVLRPLPTPASPGRSGLWLEAASPTKPHVVLNHEDEIWIWDYDKGAFVHRLRPEGWIKSMTSVDAVYSRDGTRLTVVADAYWDQECEITTWDSTTGQRLARTRVKGGTGSRLAVSPDGRRMAFGCGMTLYLSDESRVDGLVEVAKAAGERHWFGKLAFSPDSTRLAVELEDTLFVYSIGR
jgi:hypothetical protein